MQETLMTYIYEIINKITEAQSCVLEEKQKEYGISLNELKIMEIIWSSKSPKMMKDIAQLMFMTKGGMTFLINKLEEKELVARIQCGDDRRAIHIHLTEKGIQIFEEYNEKKYRILHEILTNLDPEIQNLLVTELHRTLQMAE